eukprot:924989-Pyramimonas_sp.AAC.1
MNDERIPKKKSSERPRPSLAQGGGDTKIAMPTTALVNIIVYYNDTASRIAFTTQRATPELIPVRKGRPCDKGVE